LPDELGRMAANAGYVAVAQRKSSVTLRPGCQPSSSRLCVKPLTQDLICGSASAVPEMMPIRGIRAGCGARMRLQRDCAAKTDDEFPPSHARLQFRTKHRIGSIEWFDGGYRCPFRVKAYVFRLWKLVGFSPDFDRIADVDRGRLRANSRYGPAY